MTGRESKVRWMVGLALVASVFLFFQLYYAYHLFFREQIQLFENTAAYCGTILTKPAWLARYTGEFLTQFFYLRYGGPLTLALLLGAEWLLATFLIKKTTQSTICHLWALIPVTTDWVLNFDIDYTLAPSTGLLFFLMIGIISCFIKSRNAYSATIVVAGIFGYWLIGAVSFALPVLLIFTPNATIRQQIAMAFVVLAIVLSVPLLMRSQYLLTHQQAFLEPFTHPIQLFLLLSVALALFFAKVTMSFTANHSRWLGTVPIAMSSVIITIGLLWATNFELEKTLSLDSETYFGNTHRVLENAQTQGQKTVHVTYFINLALAEQGVLPDYLLSHYQPASMGMFLPVHSNSSLLSIIFSNEVFYRLGDMNMAQHSSMLGMIFLPSKRSTRLVKRLAQINMVIGQDEAARKYLGHLQNTMYHSKWANEQLAYLNSDKTNRPKWLTDKQTLLPTSDTIRTSDNYKASLELLLNSQGNNQMALDYLLCYHLLNKDITAFAEAFKKYYPYGKRPLPKLYAEALVIQLMRDRAEDSQLQLFGISPEVVRDFRVYTNIYAQNNAKSAPLSKQFGQTYWYYYHFATFATK